MASVGSFRSFANSCSLYSIHLSKAGSFSVMMFPCASFMQACFALKGVFFNVRTFLKSCLPFPVRSYWSSALHSFSSQLFLSLRIIRCTSFRNLLYSIISPVFLASLLSAARWIVSLLVQALFRFCRSLPRISSADSFHIVSMSFQMWLVEASSFH